MDQQINKDPTIKDFEEKIEQLENIRNEQAQLKVTMDKLAATEQEIEESLSALMLDAEISSYRGKAGTVSISTRQSVALPKGQDKEIFFQYLKDIGIYEEVISVNSAWLNSFYKKEMEAAREKQDPFYVIPGLGVPFSKQILSFRKAK